MTREESIAETPQITTDRRRPGRIKNPGPELVALMRAPSALKTDKAAAQRLADAAPDAPDRSIDNRDAARGVMVGVALGLVLWVGLMTGVWWLCVAAWSPF